MTKDELRGELRRKEDERDDLLRERHIFRNDMKKKDDELNNEYLVNESIREEYFEDDEELNDMHYEKQGLVQNFRQARQRCEEDYEHDFNLKYRAIDYDKEDIQRQINVVVENEKERNKGE